MARKKNKKRDLYPLICYAMTVYVDEGHRLATQFEYDAAIAATEEEYMLLLKIFKKKAAYISRCCADLDSQMK